MFLFVVNRWIEIWLVFDCAGVKFYNQPLLGFVTEMNIRGVFRTQPYIYDETFFAKIVNGV